MKFAKNKDSFFLKTSLFSYFLNDYNGKNHAKAIHIPPIPLNPF